MRTRRHSTRAATALLVAVAVPTLIGLPLVASAAPAPASVPGSVSGPGQFHHTSSIGRLPRFGESGPARRPCPAGTDRCRHPASPAAPTASSATPRRAPSGSSSAPAPSTSPATVDAPTADKMGLALPVQGDRGREVTRLQRALIDRGITPLGGADGIFGSGTAAAIRTFQERRGLPATGVVDAATAVALRFTPRPTPPSSTDPTTTTTPRRRARPRRRRPPRRPPPPRHPPPPRPRPPPRRPPPPRPRPPHSRRRRRRRRPLLDGRLRVGSSGPAVVRLQQAILTLGVPVPGGADGIFGNATRTALVTVQDRAGLAETGEVGRADRQRLDLVLPRIGQSSSAVRRLQERLMAAGITVRGRRRHLRLGHVGRRHDVSGAQRSGGHRCRERPDGRPTRLPAGPRSPAGNPRVDHDQHHDRADAARVDRGLPRAAVSAGSPTPGWRPAVAAACTRASTSSPPRASGSTRWRTGHHPSVLRPARLVERQRCPPHQAGRHLLLLRPLLPLRPGIGIGTPVKAGQVVGFVAPRATRPRRRTCTSRCTPVVAQRSTPHRSCGPSTPATTRPPDAERSARRRLDHPSPQSVDDHLTRTIDDGDGVLQVGRGRRRLREERRHQVGRHRWWTAHWNRACVRVRRWLMPTALPLPTSTSPGPTPAKHT